MTWQVWTNIMQKNGVSTHVVPLNDLREHEEDATCWCSPRVDEELNLVIHSSADNREAFENAAPPLMADAMAIPTQKPPLDLLAIANSFLTSSRNAVTSNRGEETDMTDKEVMQIALDALDYVGFVYTTKEEGEEVKRAIEALRTALAQPEPEPVAWMHNFIDYVITKNRPTDITRNAGRWTPLYTAPPAKEWAGLTDDEYELMAEKRVTNYFFNTLDYAHDIEAMLKEKNT